MAEMPQTGDSYTLRAEWPEAQPRALVANQFAISLGVPADSKPDAIYLMVGHADPPFLTGGADEVASQMAGLQSLPIDVLGRYVFTRNRLTELIQLLQRAAEVFDQATGGEPDAGGTDKP